MRYLSCALYAEGSSDYDFFPPLLIRMCEQICIQGGKGEPVEIGPLVNLIGSRTRRDGTLAQRIEDAALASADSWTLLFVHTDGAGDPDRAIEERVTPAKTRLLESLGERHQLVPVVPVRELEAWILADGDALRASFGTTLSDDELGIPKRRKDVEKVADPKVMLEHALAATNPPRNVKRAGPPMYYASIGQLASLSALRQVPSFERTWLALMDALRALAIIR